MNKITIELTSEELFEVRFCVKRYSELYPNHPNEYTEGIRQSAIAKMTAALVKWQDSVPEDYIPQLDNNNQPT